MSSSHLRVDLEAQTLPNMKFLAVMRAVLEREKPFRFEATGFSMTPFIIPGDVLTLIKVYEKQARVGDILAFIHPTEKKLVIHRIVARRPGKFQLKGDNGKKPDGWIAFDEFIGLLTKIERGELQICFGLGPEKKVIALLSRMNVLHGCVHRLEQLFPVFMQKLIP